MLSVNEIIYLRHFAFHNMYWSNYHLSRFLKPCSVSLLTVVCLQKKFWLKPCSFKRPWRVIIPQLLWTKPYETLSMLLPYHQKTFLRCNIKIKKVEWYQMYTNLINNAWGIRKCIIPIYIILGTLRWESSGGISRYKSRGFRQNNDDSIIFVG